MRFYILFRWSGVDTAALGIITAGLLRLTATIVGLLIFGEELSAILQPEKGELGTILTTVPIIVAAIALPHMVTRFRLLRRSISWNTFADKVLADVVSEAGTVKLCI